MPSTPIWFFTFLSATQASGESDATDRSIIFVIAATILGLIVVLLVLLQLTTIRRRTITRHHPGIPETEDETDPWAESARRLTTADNGDDQS